VGIDIIITDHHQPPQELPKAVALLNPWRADNTYPERYLCGVAIAYKLAQALYQQAGLPIEASWELLDLVAIGTVADVAQLLGENHTLVRAGLQQLNNTFNPGLRALIQLARLAPGRIRERDISFALAPRINAAGRMQDAELALRLLTTTDETEAHTLAVELEELNLERQQQTEDLMKLVRAQIQSQLDKPVILVYGEKIAWPEGIIGLVASKLAEETGRPVFVLSQDETTSRGSARSQPHFHLMQALQAAPADLFERYGGHAQAAGFTIVNDRISELHAHLLRWAKQSQTQPTSEEDDSSVISSGLLTDDTDGATTQPVNGEDSKPVDIPLVRKIDLVINKPELLTMDMLNKITLLAPFGSSNPEPVFRVDNLQLVKRWPSGVDGRHLRVRFRYHHMMLNGNFLRAGNRADSLVEGSQVQVIFALEQAWSPPDSEARQEIWLKILEILPFAPSR
jgi:single-stranded-DNA-specific exonuclease